MNCLASGGDPVKVRSIAFDRNGMVTVTPPRPFIRDLDSLPMAWDLVDWKLYTYKPMKDSVLAIVSTSRDAVRNAASARSSSSGSVTGGAGAPSTSWRNWSTCVTRTA